MSERKSIVTAAKLLGCLVVGVLGSACASMGGGAASVRQETVILLHGAHLGAGAWEEVERELAAAPLQVLAMELPGRGGNGIGQDIGLVEYVQALCKVMEDRPETITVVAHSQAGAIVNQSLSDCPVPNLRRIIYVAAVSPVSGSKPFSLLSKQDEERYMESMAYDEALNSVRIVDFDKFMANFGLVQSGKDDYTLRTLSFDEPAALADEVVTYPQQRLAAIEKYYVHTQLDGIISPASQAAIAQSMDLAGEASLQTGHSPMLTEPAALADIIIRFVGA